MGGSRDSKEDKKEPYWKVITGRYKLYEKKLNKLWMKHYNVHVYRLLPYPPKSDELDYFKV